MNNIINYVTVHENKRHSEARAILRKIARRAMIDRGLLPDFSPEELSELDRIHTASPEPKIPVRDLRHLLWCAIDNDDSRDLDQLTVAEPTPSGAVKISVAIADVDAVVGHALASEMLVSLGKSYLGGLILRSRR